MLTAQGLACLRGDRLLFKNVGFELSAGGLMYVLGENGSGKSSLLRLLCGLLSPEDGEVFGMANQSKMMLKIINQI
jgi:heme exporter protein A